jgi:hypothetical protein
LSARSKQRLSQKYQVHCVKEWRNKQQNQQLQDEIKLNKFAMETPEYGMDLVKQEFSDTRQRMTE